MNTGKTVRRIKYNGIGAMELDFYAYETYCMIIIEERQDAREILACCHEIALEVERILNMYDENSELALMCWKYIPGQPYQVSELLYNFMELNLEMAELCGGAFDFTVGGLVKRWDFGGGGRSVPGESELKKLLKSTGYQHIKLQRDKRSVLMDMPGILMDPGASGKGYAIDLIVEYLKKEHVCMTCLDFGGNLYLMGEQPGVTFGSNRQWRVGIRHPDQPGAMMAVVSGMNQAISTSSWYEHYVEQDGKIYGHLLNPGNGKPAGSGLKSVTVLSERAVYADMLSTALYVMGESEGRKAARRLCETLSIEGEYLFMRADSSVGRFKFNTQAL